MVEIHKHSDGQTSATVDSLSGTSDKPLTLNEVKSLDPAKILKQAYKVQNVEWVNNEEYSFNLTIDDEEVECSYIKDDNGYWSYTTEHDKQPKDLTHIEAQHEELNIVTDLDEILNSITIYNQVTLPKVNDYPLLEPVEILETIKPIRIRTGLGAQCKYNYDYYFSNHATLAELFIVHFDYTARYCPKTKTWYLWKDNKWTKDEKNYINNMLIELSHFINKDCRNIKNLEFQAQVRKKANDLGNINKIKSVIELIKSHPCVATLATEFDTNKNLVGLQNGIYDLAADEFREAKKEDMVTESMGVKYSKDATAPKWEQFLCEIFQDDQELIDYIQMVIGYTLSGNIDEQAIWFAHGNGANGKSVFFSTIQKLFGSYYAQAQTSLFDRDDKNMGEAKMMLKGKRLAIGTELERGIRLDIKTVKDLTGGEPVTGRNLYEKSITYTPTCKVFTFGNHKFNIADTDPALWRRFVIIPFLRNFTGKERKNGLIDDLLEELDGIFNWAIEGYRMWLNQRNSRKLAMDTPQICEATKRKYMFDEDYVAQFMEECVEVGSPSDSDYRITPKQLYDIYSEWCSADGVKPKTKKNFNNEIEAKGFAKKKSGTWRWHGIRQGDSVSETVDYFENEDCDDNFLDDILA